MAEDRAGVVERPAPSPTDSGNEVKSKFSNLLNTRMSRRDFNVGAAVNAAALVEEAKFGVARRAVNFFNRPKDQIKADLSKEADNAVDFIITPGGEKEQQSSLREQWLEVFLSSKDAADFLKRTSTLKVRFNNTSIRPYAHVDKDASLATVKSLNENDLVLGALPQDPEQPNDHNDYWGFPIDLVDRVKGGSQLNLGQLFEALNKDPSLATQMVDKMRFGIVQGTTVYELPKTPDQIAKL